MSLKSKEPAPLLEWKSPRTEREEGALGMAEPPSATYRCRFWVFGEGTMSTHAPTPAVFYAVAKALRRGWRAAARPRLALRCHAKLDKRLRIHAARRHQPLIFLKCLKCSLGRFVEFAGHDAGIKPLDVKSQLHSTDERRELLCRQRTSRS
jgi:hypothetical protein